MFKENSINYYTNELNLESIVKAIDFESLDEAVHICDLSKLEEKYNNWKIFLPNITPYYAVKCNDDHFIVQILANLGCSFDCASKNEIKQILNLNVSPERIIFANPCKPVSHLLYARDNNVLVVTVDNEFEIYKLHKYYPNCSLVIRFRSEAKAAQCPLGDKFGCDAENDASALMLLAKSLNLKVIGISFHVGSGCNDFPAYDRAITTAKNLFKFGSLLGFEMHLLDIGGGFPGSDDDKFQTVAAIINQSLETNFPQPHKINVIAEPGRYFVAAAYTLICKIHAKREVRSPITNQIIRKMYYLNDGVYGSFNCILYDHQHVTVEHFLDADKDLIKFKTLIWGPSCDALDKIIEDIDLPDLCCGDLLAFPNMGAYTVPIASPFNGFMLPKILHFLKWKT